MNNFCLKWERLHFHFPFENYSNSPQEWNEVSILEYNITYYLVTTIMKIFVIQRKLLQFLLMVELDAEKWFTLLRSKTALLQKPK